MTTRAGQLFQELRSASAVKGLIGQCEDAHFDCKEWPGKDDDAQKMIAKAVCGLTNAEGGVLVIGMKAESRLKDEPDVISAPAPVADTALVKSKVLNLIGNLVEPGIVGASAREIRERKSANRALSLSMSPPARARQDGQGRTGSLSKDRIRDLPNGVLSNRGYVWTAPSSEA